MKKIFAFVLALAMVLALCACGGKPAAETTKTPEAPAQNYPLIIKSGEEASADLDGDGTVDTICYTKAQDSAIDSGDTHIGGLAINGTDFAEKVSALGYYSLSPDDSYAITDIDKNDGKLEIAIMDFGASDDLTTGFFRYDGKNISYLGSVTGVISADNSNVTFDGAGKVHSYVRLSVLQTWFADADWQVGTDGKLAVVPQDLFYPQAGKTYSVKALKDVTMYAKNDTASEKTTLTTGSEATVVATDNAEWVLCKNADGGDCWLHLSEDGQSVETPTGTEMASLAFEGLAFAD